MDTGPLGIDQRDWIEHPSNALMRTIAIYEISLKSAQEALKTLLIFGANIFRQPKTISRARALAKALMTTHGREFDVIETAAAFEEDINNHPVAEMLREIGKRNFERRGDFWIIPVHESRRENASTGTGPR